MNRTRPGFTLIELMVVVSVIVILISLMLPAANMVRERGLLAGTVQRMQAIDRALTQLGRDAGSTAYTLQREANLGGVLRLTTQGHLDAASGNWLDYSQAHFLPFPWGQPGFDNDPPHDLHLGQFDAWRTVELLRLAGILPAADPVASYAHNRSSDAGWNDRWGQPLVVGYAIYQHGPIALGPSPRTSDFDRQWQKAEQHYGYTRSVYFATAAPGRLILAYPNPAALGTALEADATRADALRTLWQEAHELAGCDGQGTPLWRTDDAAGVNAQVSAPWQGVRSNKRQGRLSLISAPQEVR